MKKIIITLTVAAAFILGACAKTEAPDLQSASGDSKGVCYNPGVNAFGSDFQSYLNSTGNSDLTGFGGSTSKTGDCLIVNEPVVFIHGNGDNASGSAMPMGGWVTSRNYFLANGYKSSELYAVNYGLSGATNAALNYHTAANISKIYRFIVAVKNYSGKAKVDVIAHSLGVTSVRAAVKGGTYKEYTGTSVYLGASINGIVDTFVGISGANRGLNSCGSWPLNNWTPTCGPTGLSINNPFLVAINGGSASMSYSYWTWSYVPNTLSMKVGSYTYSIMSYADELGCLPVMPTYCYVYARHTSYLDGQNGGLTFYSYPYGHMGNKEQTAANQLKMVKNHTTN
ncbi:MAG: hypothetical protein A2Y41_09975 [Spirochaetes bacterium GWB1_36_13]|nr:MAG: hypothetical protein A2Y41_09975 [Spirochaetes bacterium GWB1_36_13]